jgi:hypothetical protein
VFKTTVVQLFFFPHPGRNIRNGQKKEANESVFAPNCSTQFLTGKQQAVCFASKKQCPCFPFAYSHEKERRKEDILLIRRN